jgi:hypothetical protein
MTLLSGEACEWEIRERKRKRREMDKQYSDMSRFNCEICLHTTTKTRKHRVIKFRRKVLKIYWSRHFTTNMHKHCCTAATGAQPLSQVRIQISILKLQKKAKNTTPGSWNFCFKVELEVVSPRFENWVRDLRLMTVQSWKINVDGFEIRDLSLVVWDLKIKVCSLMCFIDLRLDLQRWRFYGFCFWGLKFGGWNFEWF